MKTTLESLSKQVNTLEFADQPKQLKSWRIMTKIKPLWKKSVARRYYSSHAVDSAMSSPISHFEDTNENQSNYDESIKIF